MPFDELLIKKIYTKFAGELKSDLNLNVRETKNKIYHFNYNDPLRNFTILDDIGINGIKIHLYLNKTPQNSLIYNALIKSENNDNNDKDVFSGKDSYRCEDKFYDNYDTIYPKLNDSFGGVWSPYSIKMNFID